MTVLAEAFAAAKPLEVSTLTHVSLYKNSLAFKFSSPRMAGRAFRIRAESKDGRLQRFAIEEAPKSKGRHSKGISVVDKAGWVKWTNAKFASMDPFGATPFAARPKPSPTDKGMLLYEGGFPEDFLFQEPLIRNMGTPASRIADPFLEAWDRMMKLEDEVNTFLSEHPQLTLVVQPPSGSRAGQVRFRKA